ncbi:MAG TPA: hypothetical protein VMU14_23385 [Acidimicrobiales bacterium]|nr:hypothetical protein [Acidimicrobiales bacterium]
MDCPQCGSEISEGEWNCPVCRINVYWATQHYEELAQIRAQRGLDATNSSPSFLVKSHKQAMGERPNAGVVHRVRAVARKAMGRDQ